MLAWCDHQLPSRVGHEPQQILIAHNTLGKQMLREHKPAAAVQEAGMVRQPVAKQGWT